MQLERSDLWWSVDVGAGPIAQTAAENLTPPVDVGAGHLDARDAIDNVGADVLLPVGARPGPRARGIGPIERDDRAAHVLGVEVGALDRVVVGLPHGADSDLVDARPRRIEIVGLDRLNDLIEGEYQPVVFAANHHSHLDAPLMITSIPAPWRHRLVVGAAADYFFSTRVAGALSALTLNAIPIERTKVNRRSADLATSLLAEGWSLVIFPEGGRSPDGWGQPFRGGAAFLSVRTGAPVVPVHLEGTGAVFGKGMKRPKPGPTRVTFGAPMWPDPDDDARSFGTRIERAVAVLGDEATGDWWTARRNAAKAITPPLTGPEATTWRRAWALADRRGRGREAERRRQKRTWPKI